PPGRIVSPVADHLYPEHVHIQLGPADAGRDRQPEAGQSPDMRRIRRRFHGIAPAVALSWPGKEVANGLPCDVSWSMIEPCPRCRCPFWNVTGFSTADVPRAWQDGDGTWYSGPARRTETRICQHCGHS